MDGFDADDYYVVVVPRMDEAERLGFMPRGRHYGFLHGERLGEASLFARTLAHELGHGAFGCSTSTSASTAWRREHRQPDGRGRGPSAVQVPVGLRARPGGECGFAG